MYKASPASQLDLTDEDKQNIPQPQVEPSPVSISYKDLSPDAQVQALAKLDIQADPNMIIAEKLAEQNKSKEDLKLKKEAQAHAQKIAEIQATKLNEKV
jgi:hypothetical protein